MITTYLVSASLLLLAQGTSNVAPPPGMVFLKGAKTTVGTKDVVAKDLVAKTNNVQIWGETPEHEEKVDDFFLMLTEVTNEQYAEFVVAKGAKPPENWGKNAVDAAQAAFLEEEGRRKQEDPKHEKQSFDRVVWWDLNWDESEYAVPKGAEALPVTYVDHAQARDYARWAGLRLMTEAEFQRAARFDSKSQYPWGETWESGRAVTLEGRFGSPRPVGSLPAGASPEGIHDLLGNVWEWTDSPYVAYRNHKASTLTIKDRGGNRHQELLVLWDDDQRVLVGGSFSNDAVASRASTRRSSTRHQATSAVGFRCAASPRPGLDMAEEVLRARISRSIKSEIDGFDLPLTIALDRWKSRKGSAGDRYANQDGDNPLGGYAVITDYDYFLFVPVADVGASGLRQLASDSVDGNPKILGFFSTTLAFTRPELPAGDYVLAWRGAGKGRAKPAPQDDEKQEGEKEGEAAPPPPPIWEELAFDPEKEHFIVMDGNGKPLVAVPSRGLSEDKMRAGTIKTSQVPANERAKVEAHDELLLSAAIPSARRGFLFDLPFELASDALGGDWRRP